MHRLATTGLLPVFGAVSAIAQTTPTVTEAEFLAVLDDDHPAVVERSQSVARARAQTTAAATLQNPTLSVLREDPQGPARQIDWTISWQLPDPNRRLEVESRQEALGAAEARLTQDRLQLRLQMRKAYADWAVASVREGRLLVLAARVDALADRESRRAERGEASGLEARRLVVAAARDLRARVAVTSAQLEEAQAVAKSWHPDLPAGAQPVLPEPAAPPAVTAGHPLLRAAEAELNVAILERQAAGRFVRSPELVAGWQRQEMGPESHDGPLLGAVWSFPLFGRNQARRELAAARVQEREAQVELVRRELAAIRSPALLTYRRLVGVLEETAAALAENERMLDAVEAAFRLGETGLTDLLDTHRATADSEMTLLDLHRATLAAHRELERIAGLVSSVNPRP